MEGGPTTNDTRHPATVQRVRQPLTLDACRVCDTVLRLIPNYLGGAAFHVGVTRLFSGYCDAECPSVLWRARRCLGLDDKKVSCMTLHRGHPSHLV